MSKALFQKCKHLRGGDGGGASLQTCTKMGEGAQKRAILWEHNNSMASKDRQTTIALKDNTKLRMVYIGHSMDRTIKISDPCKV